MGNPNQETIEFVKHQWERKEGIVKTIAWGFLSLVAIGIVYGIYWLYKHQYECFIAMCWALLITGVAVLVALAITIIQD